MKAYLRKVSSRFWVAIATLGLECQRPVQPQLGQADEARLIETLLALNTILARVARI